ncbi:hypothetical protein [Polyangium fumosum]|nr:hypothetical protein [Polyangium fumosum]
MTTFLRSSRPWLFLSTILAVFSAACGPDAPPGAGSGGGGSGGVGPGGAGGMGSSVSSSGPGTGGGGSGPGTGGGGGEGGSGGGGGVGGSGGAGGGSGGSGGCMQQMASCMYKTDTELDKQSFRQIAGYQCFHSSTGWEFVPTQTCDYAEECKTDVGAEAVCVSCGPLGQRFAHRDVDGQLAEDCKGCKCSGGWTVYGCYAETTTYGAPWVDVVWQQGFEVIRFALLGSGEVKSLAGPNKQVSIQNLQVNTFEIQPNGVVDFEIDAQVIHTDNFQQQHTWDMQARVVRLCK